MGHVGPNRQDAVSRKPTALIEIVRLLARQAARELAERQPENDNDAPPLPCCEERS